MNYKNLIIVIAVGIAIETNKIHFVETADRQIFVCAVSLTAKTGQKNSK